MASSDMSTFGSTADALAAIDDRQKAADQLRKANILAGVGAGAKALASIGGGLSSYNTALGRQAVYSMNAASLRATIPYIQEQASQKVNILQQETSQFIGAQRAALAANGIVVDQDTGLEAAVQAAGIGARDVVAALDAARNEVANVQNRAAAQEEEARQAVKQGKGDVLKGLFSAGESILAGANTISKNNQRYRTRTGG